MYSVSRDLIDGDGSIAINLEAFRIREAEVGGRFLEQGGVRQARVRIFRENTCHGGRFANEGLEAFGGEVCRRGNGAGLPVKAAQAKSLLAR